MANSSGFVQQVKWLSPNSCEGCDDKDLLCDKRLPFCSECVANSLNCKYGSYSVPSPAPDMFYSASEAWLSPNPCAPCRESLTLCDKGLPLCTQCVASSQECEYNNPLTTKQSGPESSSDSTLINTSGSTFINTEPSPLSHLEHHSKGHLSHPPTNLDQRVYPLRPSAPGQLENNHENRNISQPISPSAVAGHIMRSDSPHMSLVDFTGPDSYCIDCQVLYPNHAGFCNISKCKPRKLTDLTVAELGQIADAVERNDPEQWREHRAPPPTPEPEDYKTKVKEMADIVRNEESYKNDPVLHGLEDAALLILWALRTCSKIQTDIVWLDENTPYCLESASDDDEDNEGNSGESQAET